MPSRTVREVDLATVWRTAQDDLPRLLRQVQAAQEQPGSSETR